MATDEFALVELAQKGEEKAFGELYTQYVDKIYQFIYYKTHHKETAEDLTSLVFTKALSSLPKFKIGKASFKTWLYTIARNTVIDHYRTSKNEYNIDDAWDEVLDSGVDITNEIDQKIKIEEIKKYLQNLSSTQRDVIVMRVWQELSYKEIAEVLEKSEASCKMAFSRGIKQLKKEMPLGLLVLFLVNIVK